ncbi:serine hydrolase [Pedobacter sp. Leaf176]|uniref:serine hydrolase domain-containing protein n=1 Tax=Pedobacter sp. Leaf176 TaxID=1736286 RepID=UPI0006F45223|nr:serine hydrolase domain-containing protein [Pedobacter sp. Leaf176]KQR67500.1 peptidase [Pedobacter sp. Leaf176]
MKKHLLICLLIVSAFNCKSQNLNTARLDSLFQVMDKKEQFMGSISVTQNGKLLYSKAIGYADIDSRQSVNTLSKYRIGSISKMFTATLILMAAEKNKITLNQTLDRYFPEIENAKKITIENLLNHRSGIHSFTSDAGYLAYLDQYKSKEAMLKIIADGKSDFEPNSKAAYSNSNYVLLSYIAEDIYKSKYADILDKQIIKPLKLKNTYFGSKTNLQNNETYSYQFKDGKWTKEKETDLSIPMGAGGIVSNPQDLSTFISALFAGKLITVKSLDLMKTMNQKFGLGLFQFPYYDKINYGHDGAIDGFKSILIYNPEEKLSVAISSNGTQYPLNNVLIAALSAWFGKPFEVPTFEAVKISSEMLDSYAGQYSSAQIPPKISITKTGDKLFAQATGQSAFPLETASPTTFKFEQAGIVLEFNAAKKEMTLKQGGKEFLFTKE